MMTRQFLSVFATLAWTKSLVMMLLGATINPDFYWWGVWGSVVATVPTLWLAARSEAARGRLHADGVARIMAQEVGGESAEVTSLR